MIRIALFALALTGSFAPRASAQLSTGDVAIVGFWSDSVPSPRSFAFVALTDIPAGTTVSFTDRGWLASGGFRATEGIVGYTAPSGGLAAGSVVTMIGEAGGFALSTAGDQLFAFEGSIDELGNFTGTLLHGFQDNGFGWDVDATSTSTSALPPSLLNANVAMAAELDNCAYVGPTSGTAEELLAAICNPANWVGDNTTQPALPVSFSVSAPTAAPVPGREGIASLVARPNPFNPATTISFDLGRRATVRLSVFDSRGRLVATLLDGVDCPAGITGVPWEGRDAQGHTVGSGTYFYRLEAGGDVRTHKLVLVK